MLSMQKLSIKHITNNSRYAPTRSTHYGNYTELKEERVKTMADLSKANEARANNVLDQKRQFSAGIFSFREMIDKGIFNHAELVQVPHVRYNRQKFNRMDTREQAAYNKKLAETKIEYNLYYTDRPEVFVSVPKMVYDYFVEKQGC